MAGKYRSLKIGANVSYSSKKKKAIHLFILEGFLIQFLQHFSGEYGLQN